MERKKIGQTEIFELSKIYLIYIRAEEKLFLFEMYFLHRGKWSQEVPVVYGGHEYWGKVITIVNGE